MTINTIDIEISDTVFEIFYINNIIIIYHTNYYINIYIYIYIYIIYLYYDRLYLY